MLKRSSPPAWQPSSSFPLLLTRSVWVLSLTTGASATLALFLLLRFLAGDPRTTRILLWLVHIGGLLIQTGSLPSFQLADGSPKADGEAKSGLTEETALQPIWQAEETQSLVVTVPHGLMTQVAMSVLPTRSDERSTTPLSRALRMQGRIGKGALVNTFSN